MKLFRIIFMLVDCKYKNNLEFHIHLGRRRSIEITTVAIMLWCIIYVCVIYSYLIQGLFRECTKNSNRTLL